jgi:hypothetical protein
VANVQILAKWRDGIEKKSGAKAQVGQYVENSKEGRRILWPHIYIFFIWKFGTSIRPEHTTKKCDEHMTNKNGIRRHHC